MRFQFFGSLYGDRESFKLVYDCLEKLGCQPMTYHILHRKVEDVNKETPAESTDYVKRMTRWVQSADFVVFEVTQDDTSLGYEMMMSLDMGKPLLILYRPDVGQIPFTLRGVSDERIFIYPYKKENVAQLEQTLKSALGEIKEQVDTRFTLLLPPKITSFLDKISQKKKTPKAVFIRNLIEKEMKKEKTSSE
jgi:hypothetical protein